MKTNPLGDIRAENDHLMLDRVFYETPDYKSLLVEHSRRIVVGRRGTGKSALFYKLQRHWESESKSSVVTITPSEMDVIGLRPIVSLFGSKYSYLRAACVLVWQYAICQEILSQLFEHYKVRSNKELVDMQKYVHSWNSAGDSITSRLCNVLEAKVDKTVSIESRIASLAKSLDLNELESLAASAMSISRGSLHIIADRLDEGYEPDVIGIAILSGMIYAFDKLPATISNTSTTVFLRDNIFRAIQINDPDYSRNIEGDVLRLHWDQYHLFNMICCRLREVFDIKQEKNLRIWDNVTARDLQGIDGFRSCLRLTLYRPRDLLILLNSAFNHARAYDRDTIVNEDIETSAREISCSRLDDLKKEYSEVIPGISHLVSLFAGGKSTLTISDVGAAMKKLDTANIKLAAEGQTLAILGSLKDVVHILFSVGFFGIWKQTASSFVFCHDGKDPDFAVDEMSKILVHPCYWIALNLQEKMISEESMEHIHDEYDIEICSETPEIRNRKLGQFIEQYKGINEGAEDASIFEDWCLQAVRIVFATGIVNIELHPNRNQTQRRDIVGRNTGNSEAWKRILEDYGSRQIIFEVKNYSSDLGPQEYRQMLSYLCGEHGKLGFIINRSTTENLHKDRELNWVREIYHEHEHRVVVKLPAKQLVNWLSKLRNPQKHDAPDKGLGSRTLTLMKLQPLQYQ